MSTKQEGRASCRRAQCVLVSNVAVAYLSFALPLSTWRQDVPPKRWCPTSTLHGALTQKIIRIFIAESNVEQQFTAGPCQHNLSWFRDPFCSFEGYICVSNWGKGAHYYSRLTPPKTSVLYSECM